MKVVTIGLDLAKEVFQVHRADAEGGGCGAGSGGVQVHDLRLEGEVPRDGCEPGAGGEAVAGSDFATVNSPTLRF